VNVSRLLRPWGAPATVLFLLGAVLGGRAVYLRAKGALSVVLLHSAWQERVETGAPARPWPGADLRPAGRLTIPSVGLDEIVLDTASPRALAFGPARMANGAAPGEGGNVVLTGHRTTSFRALAGLRAGDEIQLEWTRRGPGSRRLAYRVESVAVVAPDDVSALRPTEREALTLVTCYPFGAGPASTHRYVVRARPATG
jgi:sortase A